MFNNFFFVNCAVYELMWKNTVGWGRSQMTIWCMRIACWITRATHTHTHSQYVILIVLPLQQWFKNMPQCYVIRTLPVLFDVNFQWIMSSSQDCKLSADSFCNKFPSISVAHFVLLKADYNAAKPLLEKPTMNITNGICGWVIQDTRICSRSKRWIHPALFFLLSLK